MMTQAPAVAPATPFDGLSTKQAIELIQAQIAGVKKEISDLTGQLTPGTSDARENAVNNQLNSANERLQSLQQQLDNAVAGQPLTEAPRVASQDPNDIPNGVQNLLSSLMVTGVILAFGIPIIRLIVRRLDRKGQATAPPDIAPRLDRLEQAMDAVAIEVERISEGQRYTNKILSDVRALPAPNAAEQWPFAKAKEALPEQR